MNTKMLCCTGFSTRTFILPDTYINDSCHAIIISCHVHHFDDDTNLLQINKNSKMLNKLISYDLKNFSNWLITSKCQEFMSSDIKFLEISNYVQRADLI